MIYAKINNVLYPARIKGRVEDRDWDNRESLAVTLEMTYEQAIVNFTDDMDWGHVRQDESYVDPEGNIITPDPVESDDSDYSVAGPITDNRDGTVTVKMGKVTAAELLETLEEALSV